MCNSRAYSSVCQPSRSATQIRLLAEFGDPRCKIKIKKKKGIGITNVKF
jgi:hypothetical protein